MKKLIAYCGLDCETCDAYIATINDDDELREKTAKMWSEMNNAPITADMINCAGCRTNGVKTPFCQDMCEIRKCALKKEFDTCGNCSELDSCETVGVIIKSNSDALNRLKKEE